jgi:CubicO group peptidase (beta-lactamase class C family)
MKIFCLRAAALTILCLGAALTALSVAQSGIDSPNIKRIQDYVAAFNAGEPQMSEFIRANAALDKRSLEDRMSVYRQIVGDLKHLEIIKVSHVATSAEQNSVAVGAHAGNGRDLTITFNFEPQPPNKLVSIRIEDEGGPASHQQPAGPVLTTSDAAKKIANLMDDLSAKDSFSGVVLVIHGRERLYEGAYGASDKATKVLNTITTKFNVGSINKIFTRVAIEQLVAQGKLSLDDKLGKFLPDYPNRDAANKVTVAELLNMTSGIGDFFGERFEAADKSKIRTLSNYLPLFADQPLLFEPGTANRYSNGGYIVLGLIVQEVSGEDYYEYVDRHILQPTGMKDTAFYLLDQIVANRAEGYVRTATGWKNNRAMLPERGSSAGGGYSTADDLLKFAIALTAGELKNLAKTGGAMPAGPLGIAGGSPGVNAELFFDPDTQTAVIVLSNYDPPSAEAPARTIEDWVSAIPK